MTTFESMQKNNNAMHTDVNLIILFNLIYWFVKVCVINYSTETWRTSPVNNGKWPIKREKKKEREKGEI